MYELVAEKPKTTRRYEDGTRTVCVEELTYQYLQTLIRVRYVQSESRIAAPNPEIWIDTQDGCGIPTVSLGFIEDLSSTGWFPKDAELDNFIIQVTPDPLAEKNGKMMLRVTYRA